MCFKIANASDKVAGTLAEFALAVPNGMTNEHTKLSVMSIAKNRLFMFWFLQKNFLIMCMVCV